MNVVVLRRSATGLRTGLGLTVLGLVACGGGANETGFGGFTPMSATAGTTEAALDTGGGETSGTDTTPATGSQTDGEASTGADDGEHALATIILGEQHVVSTVDAVPVLTASFIPDVGGQVDCSMDVGGCSVTTAPVCAVACAVGEVCVYNGSCQAACEMPCSLACGAGQECYFPIPGAPACRESESFDGGSLLFVGTSDPITLFPPYALPAGLMGPVTTPNQDVTLTASGAAGAGFAGFETSVNVVESLFSTIDEILMADAYGTGALTINWVGGDDSVRIGITVSTALGRTGTVTCDVDDAAGTFDVPRAALSAAAGVGDNANNLVLSLSRRRSTVTMGHPTTGSLLGAMVQPEGWVEFVSTSVETGTIVGCTAGLSACGALCVNTQTDAANCLTCGNACVAGMTCSVGACI